MRALADWRILPSRSLDCIAETRRTGKSRRMNRRIFLARSAASAALLLAGRQSLFATQNVVILRGGHVIDGLGGPGRVLDVAITGDRISALGANLRIAGAQVIDVSGLVIAPGFIDIHSHTDRSLLADPTAQSKIRQGVTTEIAGQDGGSVDLAGFFPELERRGASVNFASMVGAGTVREQVIGEIDRPATPAEIEQMQALVRAALYAGACGLSSGLEYVPGAFADRSELVALAGVLRGTGLPYATHMRNEDDALLAGVEEAITIGRFAKVPVHISHLKTQGARNWYKTGAVIETIESAHRDGTDITFDRYPYIAYSTGLSNLFPVWARDGGTAKFMERLADPAQQPLIRRYVEDKIAQLGSWDAVQISGTGANELAWARGKRLGGLASARNTQPYDLLIEIITTDRARTGMIGFGMDEPGTERYLAHPLCMICSDAGAFSLEAQGSPHPRAFGSFPRVLGHYVRDRKIMSLETAIMKMTSMPARRVRLQDRGEIRVGAFGDVVAFDAATVADRATFESPKAYPTGIAHVWVNGVQVVRDADHTGATPGRVVRPAR